MGSVRVSAEKRTLIDPIDIMQEALRSKSAGRGQNLTSVGAGRGITVVQRNIIGKSKGFSVASSDMNELAHNKNLMQSGFNSIEVDTSFPHDDLEVMETLKSKSAKGNMKNVTSVAADRGSTILQRTSIENSKGLSVVSSDTNVLEHNKNLVQPDFDQVEDKTSFPHDDHEAMQGTLRSKSGRAQSFQSVGSVRKIDEKRTLDGKSKSRKNVAYDLSELTQNNNIFPPEIDLMEDDLTLHRDEVEVMQDTRRSKTSACGSDKVKKVRGPNLCKVVTGLKPGEKLRVTFYQNRVVGDHHALFSRHLGSIVRNRNMCPLRVHSWADIEEAKLDHMWEAVTEKFHSDDMNDYRDHVLKHMRRLWNNWRGSLHMNAKSKPLQEVLKYVPEGVDKGDWDWLVKEHFLTEKFKKTSTRNAINRSKLSMPHRTGSKPIREIIYELIEIQEVLQSEPSLTNIEVVERCFGPQRKSHVVGFGGGITSKDLKGGCSAKADLLEDLNASRKEKAAL